MKLLEEYHSIALDLKNRVIMAPMTRSRANNEDHAATELIAEYYAQRASAGLIITEGTFVNPLAPGYINVPHIYTKNQIEGWRKVTTAVHEKGGKIFAQLWHVGRLSHPDMLNGQMPVAPSAINPNDKAYTKNGFTDTLVPREMTLADIDKTILDFQQAAVNAIEAGFDGIEIHAANGYLFQQFFAKCANIRTDEYGGSIENRTRFLFAVLDAVKDKIGADKIGIRIAPSLDQTFGISKDDETDALYDILVNRLNAYKLAYLHISGFTRAEGDDALRLVLATATHFRSVYHGTLIINKGFDQHSANDALEAGTADLVAFGELYIGNPDLVERFAANAPLNQNDRSTYYTPGPAGYTDYPSLS